jgi:hypothetical protein
MEELRGGIQGEKSFLSLSYLTMEELRGEKGEKSSLSLTLPWRNYEEETNAESRY